MSTPSDQDSKAPKRNKKADLIYQIAVAMCRGKTGLPKFPQRFEVLQDEAGVRRPIAVDAENVCRSVHPSFVEGEILRYFFATKHSTTVNLNPSDMRQIFNAYMSLAQPTPEEDIKPLLQRSTKGMTWNRLPFDLTDGPTPTFDEIMGRTKNAPAFMAWIGSLMFPRSDVQQYVWCHGDGLNGKSRIFNQLSKVIGPGYAPENTPRGDGGRFWTSGIIGKRLVVFNDCDDVKFPSSGFFKNLSGGEPVRVEVKGGASFKATLSAKFAFVSNLNPELSGMVADRRRAIYVEIGPIQGPLISTEEYDALLDAEIPHWLHKCVETYKRLCPKGGRIPVDQEGLENVISDAEEPLEAFFEECLVLDENAYMRPYELLNLMKANDIRYSKDQRKFIRWLMREKGIQKVRLSDKGRKRVYQGIRGVGNSQNEY